MAKRPPKLIKVCLVNRGEDPETPWAQDLGPAPNGAKGSRRVRLVNVPFLHAKPTWGDIVIVTPVADGLPTWDANGVAWSKIDTRIDEDGGRYAMIIDYLPHDLTDGGNTAFKALYNACAAGQKDLQKAPIVCEGAFEPRDDRPGRAYLAVQDDIEPAEVMATLRAANLPCELVQIHPEPPKGKSAGKAKAAAAKPKPAAKATTKPKLAARAKPAAKAKAKAKPAAKAKAKGKAKPAAKAKGKPAAKAKPAKRPAKAAGKRRT
ncbi:MAG: hypothetical protein M3680_26345 [Myxococcota bacterium]|nr:hypothetical protein [Myxococcota bacterium]